MSYPSFDKNTTININSAASIDEKTALLSSSSTNNNHDTTAPSTPPRQVMNNNNNNLTDDHICTDPYSPTYIKQQSSIRSVNSVLGGRSQDSNNMSDNNNNKDGNNGEGNTIAEEEEVIDENGDIVKKPPPTFIDRALNAVLPPGSIPAASFNLCSATLGAGTIGIPYAMFHGGSLIGSIGLALVGASTIFTCDLIVLTLEATGFDTYEKLALNLVGPKFEKFVAFVLFSFCWGVAVVFTIVIGDIMKPLQTLSWLPQGEWGNRLLTVIFWAVFMLPLSNLRDINSLRYASMIGFFASVYLVFALTVYAALNEHKQPIELGHKMDFDFWSALTVFTFSYGCQTNVCEVYHEMKDRSPATIKKASTIGMTVCTMLYILCGLVGVWAFGTEIDANVLSNFSEPQSTVYIAIAFVCIAITVTLAFPVAILPTRDAVLQVLGYRNAYHTPTKVRMLVCTLLASSSLILGLFVPNIQVLFSILGGLCGSSVCYVFPVIFAWRAGVVSWEKGKLNYILAWTICIGGGIFGLLGTSTTIISLIEGDHHNNNSKNTDHHGNSSASNATNVTTMIIENLLV